LSEIIYYYNVNGDSKSGELAHVFALGGDLFSTITT